MLSALQPLELGDAPGHDFHGNQYTGGLGGTKERETEAKRLLPEGWKAKAGQEGVNITAPSGATYKLLNDAHLVTRLAQIAGAEGATLRGDTMTWAPSWAPPGRVTVLGPPDPTMEDHIPVLDYQGKVMYVPQEDVLPLETLDPEPAVQREVSVFTDELRDNVRQFGTQLYDDHPDYAEAINQFSMNSPDEPAALELRAALVDEAGADRDVEWVDGWDPDVDGNGEKEYPLEGINPSGDLRDAAQDIHARYESPDPALDQKVTLYRGAFNTFGFGKQELDVNILSSWTPSSAVASRFGTPLVADIPLRQIIGEGAIGEDELYVYSPDQTIVAETYNGVLAALEFGDVAGHDFHGNQWTAGDGRTEGGQQRSQFTSPFGEPMTRSQIGDTMEAIAVMHPQISGALKQRFNGNEVIAAVGALAGKARQGPWDLRVGNTAIELKSVHASSTTQKATIKRSEQEGKLAAISAAGLDPATAVLVWEPVGDGGRAHVFVTDGIVSGTVKKFEELGVYDVPPTTFQDAFKAAGYA